MAILQNTIAPVGGQSPEVNEPRDGRVLTSTGQRFLVGSPISRCVTRITSKPDREGKASAQKNGLLYETLQRQYTRKYTVYTNNAHVGPSQILQTVGVPYVGGVYPYASYGDAPDVLATCVDVKVSATSNPKIWDVTAEFDTDRLVSQFSDNPLRQPPDIQWDSQAYELPMRYDYYGISCTSSSGNQFDPPAMVEFMRTLYRVTRNEAFIGQQIGNVPIQAAGIRVFDPNTMEQYRRKLNISSPIFVINPDNDELVEVGRKKFMGRENLTARINYINAHRMMTNGILHWQVVYEIEFRVFPDTFIEQYLDQDFRDPQGNIFRDPRDQMAFQNQTPMNGRGQPIFTVTPSGANIANNITRLLTGIDANAVTFQMNPALYSGGFPGLAFPPPAKAPDTNGIIIGPNYHFYVRIDDEVMLVTKPTPLGSFTVQRAQKGTIAVAHSSNAAVILEPYFLRFIPSGPIDFGPLGLEQI